MRCRVALTAMASVIAVFACCAGASAHGYGYGDGGLYRDRMYAAIERQREARERYRARREERAYERHMDYQRRLEERRNRVYDWDSDGGRWRHDAYRAYRNYGDYCDCPDYRDYAYAPRTYDYSHYMLYPRAPRNDRIWAPDAYPAGWPSWWLRMDREGRAGRN